MQTALLGKTEIDTLESELRKLRNLRIAAAALAVAGGAGAGYWAYRVSQEEKVLIAGISSVLGALGGVMIAWFGSAIIQGASKQ